MVDVVQAWHAVAEVGLKILAAESSLFDGAYSKFSSIEVFDHIHKVIVLHQRWRNQNIHQFTLLRNLSRIWLNICNFPLLLEIIFVIILLFKQAFFLFLGFQNCLRYEKSVIHSVHAVVGSQTVTLLFGVLMSEQRFEFCEGVETLHLDLNDRAGIKELIELCLVSFFLILAKVSIKSNIMIIEEINL